MMLCFDNNCFVIISGLLAQELWLQFFIEEDLTQYYFADLDCYASHSYHKNRFNVYVIINYFLPSSVPVPVSSLAELSLSLIFDSDHHPPEIDERAS